MSHPLWGSEAGGQSPPYVNSRSSGQTMGAGRTIQIMFIPKGLICSPEVPYFQQKKNKQNLF